MKWKAFLIIFKGLSVPRNWARLTSGPMTYGTRMTKGMRIIYGNIRFTGRKQSLLQMHVGWGSWIVLRFSWIISSKPGLSYFKPFRNASKSVEATSMMGPFRGNSKSKNLSQNNPIIVKKQNPIKWLNILKQFDGCCWQIVWVCLTILWGCLVKMRDALRDLVPFV